MTLVITKKQTNEKGNTKSQTTSTRKRAVGAKSTQKTKDISVGLAERKGEEVTKPIKPKATAKRATKGESKKAGGKSKAGKGSKTSGRKGVKKDSEYSENKSIVDFKFVDASKIEKKLELANFIRWIAIPERARVPKTHIEFGKQFGVSIDTLTDWKKLSGFWDEVNEEMKFDMQEKAVAVADALYENALKSGNKPEVELFFKLFKGYREKIENQVDINSTELTKDERAEMEERFVKWKK